MKYTSLWSTFFLFITESNMTRDRYEVNPKVWTD